MIYVYIVSPFVKMWVQWGICTVVIYNEKEIMHMGWDLLCINSSNSAKWYWYASPSCMTRTQDDHQTRCFFVVHDYPESFAPVFLSTCYFKSLGVDRCPNTTSVRHLPPNDAGHVSRAWWSLLMACNESFGRTKGGDVSRVTTRHIEFV